MLIEYSKDHNQWVQDFFNSYKPSVNNNFLKLIFIDGKNIKVLKMQHIIIPIFVQGISIMTCGTPYKNLLVNENTD